MMDVLNQKAKDAFKRFSPFIREYVYRNGWNELRKVQIEAAYEIFHTENNILLSSETASGKTEAALFPILSLMEEESPEYFTVLYISPLKALINDQYSRVEELLKESGLPVFRWHGDVGRSHKEKFLSHPSGILQITPESLESMLCRRANDIPRLFGHLKFVIIDELHSLIGSDRGYQILCQLQRIARLISHDPRRIALSATIGDPKIALRWLSGGSTRESSFIKIEAEKAKWNLGICHFYNDELSNNGENAADHCIFEVTQNKKCVVFSNSREETEAICASLRQISHKRKESDRFYIHHGNLSAAIREDTELALKDNEKTITACATVTLELGVDIGRLERIINQGSPISVSGFLQRIGRSGRRDLPPEMLMVFREDEPLPNTPIHQCIPWEMIQAIAIVELYRRERWIEPGFSKPSPFSLLFHQTLSILSANASMTPPQLAKAVLGLAPFASVDKEDYKKLLIHMVKLDYLQRTEEGQLIIGLKGERILSSFRFFAVFRDSDDITVRCGSEDIGTIASAPPIGERFALAGRVWEVEEADVSKKMIFVKPVEGKMQVSWPGSYGYVHTRILEEIKRILVSEDRFAYLSPAAAIRLDQARSIANKIRLSENQLIFGGGSTFVYFPWLGTKSFQSVLRILKKYGGSEGIADVQSNGCYFITFRSDRNIDEIKQIFYNYSKKDLTPEDLLIPGEIPIKDKFDSCLPLDLARKSFASNSLDLFEAQNRMCEIK